ncbi:MAG TPA: GNAT family N-acetyltransferase [Solirubrobacteraceae bacterium]
MLPSPFTLRDGTRVVVRPIEPGDKARLAEGLRRLSERTIRRRFLAAKPRFSSTELRYLTEVDGVDHVALVAVLADDPDALVAVARFVRLPDRPGTAEMAVVVGDAYQGLGLGRRLAQLLADEARRGGVVRFAATMLGENLPAQRVMRTITERLEGRWAGGGVRELIGDLAA